jgi:stage II sporulation protein D
VYRGVTRTDPVADGAIQRTRGAILLADANLVEGYYSSTCGGHTSRIDAVWSKPFEPYLHGVRDALDARGTFCAHSPHFRWTEAWSGAEMESLLASTLPAELGLPADQPIGRLVDLRTAGRSASGRVEVLEVETSERVYVVRGDRIRWVLRRRGGSILRSILLNLEVERQGDRIVRVIARGGGNGHGVGMCQNGALEMARRGYDRAAILEHYFPGTTLRRLYE